MPNYIDMFIQNVCEAAQTRNIEEVKKLIENGPKFNVSGNNGLNIPIKLASINDMETLKFLGQLGIKFSLIHLIYGAAYGNQRTLLKLLLKRANESQLDIDFSLVASYAALNGHRALIDEILENKPCNYNQIAAAAARTGNKELAENYLNKFICPKRDYNFVARSAAEGNHPSVAMYFINKVDKSQRDYKNLAAAAVVGGNKDFAEEIFNNIDISESNYLLLAQNAAMKGHAELADYFINKSGAKNKELILLQVFAKAGFKSLTQGYLQHAVNSYGHDKNMALKLAAQAANEGGHHHIANYFLSFMDKNEKEENGNTTSDLKRKREEEEQKPKKRARRDPLEIDTVEGKEIRKNLNIGNRQAKMDATRILTQYKETQAESDPISQKPAQLAYIAEVMEMPALEQESFEEKDRNHHFIIKVPKHILSNVFSNASSSTEALSKDNKHKKHKF